MFLLFPAILCIRKGAKSICKCYAFREDTGTAGKERKLMKKIGIRLALAVLALCMLLPALVSCTKQGKSLYYLNFKPEVASVYDEIAAKYKAETGITLRVVTAASGTYEQTLKSEIGKADAPVLFQINGPTGYASWKNYCADLSGTEIYKHLTDKSLCITDGNGVYGIPYVVEGYGIIYNEEITDKYFALKDRGTNYQSMADITGFLQLKALVEDMTAHKEALGIEGVFAATSLKSGEDWRWHTHLANVPIYYEYLDRKVNVANPADYKTVLLTYSDAYRNIFDLYINNSTISPKLLGSKQVADSMAEFALGKCAMVQNGNWAYSQIADVAGNTVKKDKVKFLPIYTGISGESEQGLCIGTENYLAINKNVSEEKQKMAADFLLWLYNSESGKEFVTKKLEFIAPFDGFTDATQSSPLSAQVNEWMHKDAVFNIPWVFQTFPSQNFKDDVGAALLQYAQGSITWDRVKEIFVKRWAEEAAGNNVTPNTTPPTTSGPDTSMATMPGTSGSASGTDTTGGGMDSSSDSNTDILDGPLS